MHAIKFPTPLIYTEDYLFLEFQDGISSHKKHLFLKFLPVMKALWKKTKVGFENSGRWGERATQTD